VSAAKEIAHRPGLAATFIADNHASTSNDDGFGY